MLIKLEPQRINHGEEKTFTVVIDAKCEILSLFPKEGEKTDCLTTLGVPRKCAVYGTQVVTWSVPVGKELKITDLPFTMEVKIKFTAYKGEFYGAEKGQPALKIGKNFAPKIRYEKITDE